jgi:hypothetical protein
MSMRDIARSAADVFQIAGEGHRTSASVIAGADNSRREKSTVMAKPVRFPRKLECWVTDAIADGLELLAADQLLSVSDHMRQALSLYLQHRGVLTPHRPATNGQHQPRDDRMRA